MTIEALCKLTGCAPSQVTSKRLHCRAMGSFLRGKEDCGDIDMLISPPPECELADALLAVVLSCAQSGAVVHTLMPAVVQLQLMEALPGTTAQVAHCVHHPNPSSRASMIVRCGPAWY